MNNDNSVYDYAEKQLNLIKTIILVFIFPFIYFLGYIRYSNLLIELGLNVIPTFIYSEPRFSRRK